MALDTSELCANLFAEMGKNITLQDIDIAKKAVMGLAGRMPVNQLLLALTKPPYPLFNIFFF